MIPLRQWRLIVDFPATHSLTANHPLTHHLPPELKGNLQLIVQLTMELYKR